MSHTGKASFVRKRYVKLQWAHSIVMLVMTLAACNPAMPATQILDAATRTEMPSASLTPIIPASTPSPAAEETYPTYTPAPTATALATLSPGESPVLTSLYMSDELHGWGIDAGEHIVHTMDGGHTWKDVTPRNGAYRKAGFFALDGNTAWATPYYEGCWTWQCSPRPNNASVWHTTDGGETWQSGHICLQYPECNFGFDPFYYYPTSIHFVDAQTGWMLITVNHNMFQDDFRFYQTIDGGAHWTIVNANLGGAMVMSFTGMAFQDGQTGWISTSQLDGATEPSGEWGLFRSTDAGLTWDEISFTQPNPLPEAFTNNTPWCGAQEIVLLPPDTIGVTVQCRVYEEYDPESSYSFYFHSTDDGETWISWQKTGDVEFIDPLVGWRSTLNNGAYDLEQTRDGGQTWTKLKTVTWNGDLEFVNEMTGWAIATSGDAVALLHTTDGGQTWEEIKPVVRAP